MKSCPRHGTSSCSGAGAAREERVVFSQPLIVETARKSSLGALTFVGWRNEVMEIQSNLSLRSTLPLRSPSLMSFPKNEFPTGKVFLWR